ncbi:MAG TPA: DUF433 domain-containing protein [Chthonomonadaceae bacterium]|nr:DUF433 domain-containing protein [Chthonomonadaceae bacterium]
MVSETLLGVGLYSLPEAARLLRMPSATLRTWVEGRSVPSKEGRQVVLPVLHRPLQKVEGETVLTFQDLIELHFISLFRSEGVSLQTIRAASERAAVLFRTDHPFAVQRLRTDGKRIFAELTPKDIEAVRYDKILDELALGQTVIDSLAKSFFRKLDYDAHEVRRWWPLGRENRVVLDSERAFGKPIDAKSGVPTHALYRMVRGGESPERVAAWYGVELEAVQAAIEVG